jgi:hypothetical protein
MSRTTKRNRVPCARIYGNVASFFACFSTRPAINLDMQIPLNSHKGINQKVNKLERVDWSDIF